jgi:hypothetical protein
LRAFAFMLGCDSQGRCASGPGLPAPKASLAHKVYAFLREAAPKSGLLWKTAHNATTIVR